ncbi:hypothetical protein P3X46_023594 [Hevea brasiliensis]|uniref:Stress up-regulated Nod 19 protein n=1 Tax=Hevea brasiliensis TaxID=3981 RepID=A0ABQ9LEX1_HEVBR|nr:uncharacterized protein LOC110659720 [Hevea brasiliensis]XP_021673443.2 uncharacterized protein LOC110659720 [Hevea brasiliensis]KAJ9163975.1 hypothetical protein P3X46_023594 [Hevea brasiliensis]
MAGPYLGSLLSISILILAFHTSYSQASLENGNEIKSATFLSPKFVLGPGSVENRFYYNIDFPRGHIAIKSFNAEVIDEAGNPVPLHETYLHHWVVVRYYQRLDVANIENNDRLQVRQSDHLFAGNSGICQGSLLRQYFGLGSETRRTATHVPDPYGIEIGNPAEIPAGYEERWLLNVHAIDTRGAEDKLGCTECRCDLYNVTVDEYDRPLRPDYKGGLFCCYDHTQCKVRTGFEGTSRSLYLRYTVKWIAWDSSIIPVKIFIFDVTDTGKRLNVSTGINTESGCQVEYEVEACSTTGVTGNGCIHIKRTSLTMPTGGYVIYGVAHQHTGGVGSTLHGEDGRVICTSVPTYGEGMEAGNEAGYIVGMSTCYPKPGSIEIADGERLILESKYSNAQKHTGVMGLFYILVADRTPKHTTFLDSLVHAHESVEPSTHAWAVVVLLGFAITVGVAAAVHSWLKKGNDDGYQPIRV